MPGQEMTSLMTSQCKTSIKASVRLQYRQIFSLHSRWRLCICWVPRECSNLWKMMRIFKKKDSVPQLIKIEELAEKRQDMEINPKPSRDFSQPVHQTPTPKDKRRSFFGRVGGVFRRLFRCGKKKKYVANDLQGNVYESYNILYKLAEQNPFHCFIASSYWWREDYIPRP